MINASRLINTRKDCKFLRKLLRFEQTFQSSKGQSVPLFSARRYNSTLTYSQFTSPVDIKYNAERPEEDSDVLIIGAGPAGLSAAIKLKQLNADLRVVVLEKGAEAGSHILSGAVIETKALDELLPDWRNMNSPLKQKATSDSMLFLTKNRAFSIPHPPQMSNVKNGNYIVSLSRVVSWLAAQAEELGVEIYPGFAGAALVFDERNHVVRVTTNESGILKTGEKGPEYDPGMTFKAKSTFLAEGAHGSLSQAAIAKYNLREGRQAQTYGLGVKEVWRVRPEVHDPGKITHSLGWPLNYQTYGGSWSYHMEDGLVSLGLVVGLDYKNPTLSPFKEFQRMKNHPHFQDLLSGGSCLAYGARALNEGGLQSIPKLIFPGGALIGCSAGFLNVPKIKGTHNAMKSGMIAAECFVQNNLDDLEQSIRNSWIGSELREVRNVRPSFNSALGLYGGSLYSGFELFLTKGHVPWTLKHHVADHQSTKPIGTVKKIEYPKPDGVTTFDILTSVSRTGTNHSEFEPSHLILRSTLDAHIASNVGDYGGLLAQACPASVYEYVQSETPLSTKLVINSQNCIHCKTCSIKVPDQSIAWTVPEGGGGPKYF